MSYSRWSHSKWYTYWDIRSDETKNGQIFTVCGEKSFSYARLKADINACLLEVENGDDELMGYMLLFMSDIEGEFKEGKK